MYENWIIFFKLTRLKWNFNKDLKYLKTTEPYRDQSTIRNSFIFFYAMDKSLGHIFCMVCLNGLSFLTNFFFAGLRDPNIFSFALVFIYIFKQRHKEI